jgi:hypothetical protein
MDIDKLKVGYNQHRLKSDDHYYKKECNFVKVINDEMKHNTVFLSQIVYNGEINIYLTEHEEKVVLSVIQWLGTPVGQSLIDKVNKM